MTGAAVIDETENDFAALGIVYEEKPETEKQYFAVFPENVDAITMFLRLSTQWRMSFSGATGLDYTAVVQLINFYGVKDRLSMFEDIKTMEGAALSKMNEAKSGSN